MPVDVGPSRGHVGARRDPEVGRACTGDEPGSSPMAAGRAPTDHGRMENGGYASASRLKLSDAEREPALESLKDAFAEGRLDQDEFEMRMHLAMTARTRADLAAVVADLGRPLPAAVPGPPSGAEPTGEDRMLAALAHGSGMIPLIIPPLVIMLLSGKRSEYVRRQAAEAVNFQLTLLLVTIVTFGLGAILYAVSWIAALIAAVYAIGGQKFRYPWTLRPIK